MAVDNSGASPAVAEREPDLTKGIKVSLPSSTHSSPNSSSEGDGLQKSPSASSVSGTALISGSHSIDAILGLKAAERNSRHLLSHHPHHHNLHHHLNNNNDTNHLNHHHFLSSHMMNGGSSGGGGVGGLGSANKGRGGVLGSLYIPPGCHSGGDGSEHNFSDSGGGSGPPSLSGSGSVDYHFEQMHHHPHHHPGAGMDFPSDHRSPSHHNNSNQGRSQQSSAEGSGIRRGIKRRIKGEPASGKSSLRFNYYFY